MGTPARFLGLLAIVLVALAAVILGLRDTVLVPLITGDFGYSVLDGFWTPLFNWLALGLIIASPGIGGAAMWAAHRQLTWEQVPLVPVVGGGCLLVVVFGIAIGTIGALIAAP